MSALTSQPSQHGLKIKELPTTERPRERLRLLGPHALSTTELLATVLGSGNKNASAMACAEAIFERGGGSLGRLASMPLATLTRVHGVGTARAAAVQAALELGRRMTGEAREAGQPLRGPRDVAAAYAPRLQDAPVEEFHVAILDAQHRLERDVLVTRGLLNSSLAPSAEDRAVTEQLVAAGRLLDIPVHDHVIVGRGRYVSFAEAGLL